MSTVSFAAADELPTFDTLVLGENENPVDIALALDRAADTTGVNFIGGYSALVQKGATESDLRLIHSIPEALSETSRVCSSVSLLVLIQML